ncbi:MAG: hypothetical protein C0473_01610 [Cyanobacteria bacterium DS3.002]|nr:hypothetical protein [Cyanobacteria bacterium DS3.002]MBA4049558.1 hypothetical protein [Cyanobacteria bacterium DS2.008]
MESFELKKQKQLQPLPESSGGGIGKPPKPTAVGTGGSDDNDDAKRTNELIRYSIGENWLYPRSTVATDWPLPSLGFYQLNVSKQVYSDNNAIVHALHKLHIANSLVAHLVVSDGFEKSHSLGISTPWNEEITNSGHRYLPANTEFLNSLAWPGTGICRVLDEHHVTEQLRIGGSKRYVGCVTGSPAINAKNKYDLAEIMQGAEYGILTLAAPVPPERLCQEEKELRNVIGRDQPAPHKSSTQSDYQMLEKIQNSSGTGIWQSCVFYFSKAQNFSKLETTLFQLSTSPEEKTRPFFRYAADLTTPLNRIAMPLCRSKHQDISSLTSYEYLTPLTASELAHFITI